MMYQLPRGGVLSDYSDSNHKIGDMNEDGYDDIILSYSRELLDDEENVIGYEYRIGILYNNGNLSFDLHLSNVIDIDEPNMLPLTDLDQDGSLDIIISPTNPKTDGWSSFVLFNNLESANELELYPSWGSKILRAGSYWKFDILSNRKYLHYGSLVNFNISISYFGMDGPYLQSIQNLSKWWTYWTVPDYPSNNAYLKIEGMGMVSYYGPFTIYSKNDSKYLIEPSFSVSGNYLYGGREVSVILDPDPQLHEIVSIDLTLEHSNGSIDLGTHLVDSGSSTSFQWVVPDDLIELDCRFKEQLTFMGTEVVVVGDEGYNILNDSGFLEEVQGDKTVLTWMGYTSEMAISCFSKDMSNLTHSAELEITSDSNYFSTFISGEGTISLTGLKIGSDWLTVSIKCFGVKKSFSSYITVEKSVGSLNLTGDIDNAHTGDKRTFNLSAIDLLGRDVNLGSDEVEWTVFGPGTILFSDDDHVNILCNGTGTIRLYAEVDAGYGPVNVECSFDVLSLISDVELSISGPIVIGKEIEISAEAFDPEGGSLSGYDVTWNMTGNASFTSKDNGSLIIVPHDDGPLELTLETHYYNESQIWSFLLRANLSLTCLMLSYQTLDIALYGTQYIDVIPQTYNGSVYPLEVKIEIIKENAGILSHRIDDKRITLIGHEVGNTDVEIRVSTPYECVSTTLTITVFNPPYDIVLHAPYNIVRGVEYNLNFDIVDRSYVPISYNNCQLEIENATFSDLDGLWIIRADDCGVLRLVFHVMVHDIDIVRSFDLVVFPGWDHMDIHLDSIYIREGDEIRIEPVVVLENGSITGLTDPTVVSGSVVEFEIDHGEIIIRSAPLGTLLLTLGGYYTGIYIEDEFRIVVLEKPVLTDITFIFHNSSGKTIVEVTVYDQYGINITDRCDFTFIGDISSILGNIVEVHGRSLSVIVSLNGNEMTREILDGDKGDSHLSVTTLIILLSASILIVLILVFMVARKYLLLPSSGDSTPGVRGEE